MKDLVVEGTAGNLLGSAEFLETAEHLVGPGSGTSRSVLCLAAPLSVPHTCQLPFLSLSFSPGKIAACRGPLFGSDFETVVLCVERLVP